MKGLKKLLNKYDDIVVSVLFCLACLAGIVGNILLH